MSHIKKYLYLVAFTLMATLSGMAVVCPNCSMPGGYHRPHCRCFGPNTPDCPECPNCDMIRGNHKPHCPHCHVTGPHKPGCPYYEIECPNCNMPGGNHRPHCRCFGPNTPDCPVCPNCGLTGHRGEDCPNV
jgi:hypothetical protein